MIFLMISIISFFMLSFYLYKKQLKLDNFSELGGIKIIQTNKNKLPHFGINKEIDKDAFISADGTLRVKNSIIFKDEEDNEFKLDENKFKKLKSFLDVFYNNTNNLGNNDLCLVDDDDNNVCIRKEELGVLTGQTPFKLNLAYSKTYNDDGEYETAHIDNQKAVEIMENELKNNNQVKPLIPSSNPLATSLFDKNFILLPGKMEDIGNHNNSLWGFDDYNYFCYLEDKQPDSKYRTKEAEIGFMVARDGDFERLYAI